MAPLMAVVEGRGKHSQRIMKHRDAIFCEHSHRFVRICVEDQLPSDHASAISL
jgi:hypothetical protein